MSLDGLLPYATKRQEEFIHAIKKHGSQRKAAEAIGVCSSTIDRAMVTLKLRAAARGHSPEHDMTRTVPEGFQVKGVSTYYDQDGQVKGQWVKSNQADEDRREAMQAFVESLCDEIKPAKPTKRPKTANKDLLVAYPIGDHHFGMYAHAAECGTDYDLKIAKQCIVDAVDYLVESAPPADQGLLVNLGDYLHADDSTGKTRKSGHLLDTDSRHHKVTRTAAFALAHTVDRLLEKHREVKVINCRGNHDEDSSHWLSTVLLAYFRNEKRVIVEDSPAYYQFHQFGQNMICATHGDKVKLPDMPQVMASLQPKMWGDTKYRVAWTGHVHHSQTVIGKENRGAIAESFGVLPPSDAYSAGLAYHAQREMHAITLKRSGGVLCRTTYNANLK